MGQNVFSRESMVQGRRVLASAEAAYRTMVAARQVQRGAAASMGERLGGPRAGRAAEISPPDSALLHEVDRA